MPLIEGKVNPLKFNAQTLRECMLRTGLFPVHSVPVQIDVAQALLEEMIAEGMVEADR